MATPAIPSNLPDSAVQDTDGFTHSAYREDVATTRYNLSKLRDLRLTKTVNVGGNCTDVLKKKEELRQYFHNTFELYEKVYECLNGDEAYYIPPVHKLRHPLIFYLGHTATFYMNKLVVAGVTQRINPKFEEMFAVGVDEMSWDDLNSAHYNWPKPSEVWKYRAQVRDHVNELFATYKLELPMTFEQSTTSLDRAFFWTILMGMEHERIHLETASVHVRELPIHLVRKHPFWVPCRDTGAAPKNELVPIAGGMTHVGRPFDSPVYGWDVDYGTGKSITVAPFEASKYLVTNEEFYEFVQDGGYSTQRFWDEEGWRWVTWKKPTIPWFWRQHPGSNELFLRTQVDEIPLPWDWPCEVNNLEAKAFCNWKTEKLGRTLRLLTEPEWTLLWDRYVKADQYEWEYAPGNINLEYFSSSCPVTLFQQGDLYDVIGNAWQHCDTPVYPFEGFQSHPFYDDFSMPTFDGRHYCMKGGTWISTGNEATRDARFAFRRHFFQYIGIRYVVGPKVDASKLVRNVLGMDPEVDQITQFAFTNPTVPGISNFPAALANVILSSVPSASLKDAKVLELYCGAGRVAFELSPHVRHVDGIDCTARRLQPAYAMKERGVANYSVLREDNGKRTEASALAEQFTWGAYRDRVTFYQSDASNLHAHLDGYDIVIAWNVLETNCRPNVVVPHLLQRLKSGGRLILASTYAWDQKVAPREYWTSKKDSEDTTTTLDWISNNFAAQVTMFKDPVDLYAVVPKSSRIGELRTYQVSFWKKQ